MLASRAYMLVLALCLVVVIVHGALICLVFCICQRRGDHFQYTHMYPVPHKQPEVSDTAVMRR